MDSPHRSYVISLAREPQKRDVFFRRNGETGLNFEVFDAIDGHALAFDEFARNGTVKADAVRYTQGALGCAASHRALWTEAESSACNILILEDDVYCRRDIAQQLSQLLSGLRDWDVVLLGYNTDAVLDFKIAEHSDFAGFFSHENPSRELLESFTKVTTRAMPMRLNNAFGLCCYLVSPQGARKLLSLFPLDNRPVRIPGNRAKFGKDVFSCTTIDMITNTLYPRMNAYAAIPPLALPVNDQAASTTRSDIASHGNGAAPRNPAAAEIPAQRSSHGLRQGAMKAFVKSIARKFGYELRDIAPAPSTALADFINAPELPLDLDFGDILPPRAARESGSPVGSAQSTRSLIVEGWRFLPHSYAIVNQWQLLSLSRRPDVALKVIDSPLYLERWEQQEGLFDPLSEQILKSIGQAAPDENADLVLRMSYPLDFTSSTSRQTAVFGTSEYQTIRKEQCRDYRVYQQFQKRLGPLSDVKAVTPSYWSAEGFYKSGFKTDQVVVVPHGVDTGTFRPMPDLRRPVRRKLSLVDDNFVFLSVGAVTPNKGIDLLLRAFAEVSRKYPHARLVLKGLNPLHHSKGNLFKIMQKLAPRDQDAIIGKMRYFGRSFSNRDMALLYQAADAYVSPYRAEGFNIPVLEAAASGIPIICTDGGATDDFVTAAFAQKIESSKQSNTIEGQAFAWLEPKLDHLVALMTSAIEDRAWAAQAAKAGPQHVEANFTWDRVVATLLQELSH